MNDYVIICGTNRNESVSIQIANYYRELLQREGIEAGLVDLKQLPDDFAFSALYEYAGKNKEFNPMREKMLHAKKFIFVVPEYNGSFPGVLKAFIDGLQFPNTFKNKKAALVGVSSGNQGAGPALSHLTDILNYCGTHVLALKPKLAYIDKNFDSGMIKNDLYTELLETQVQDLMKF
jgi:NAD(P)H-dependent FMN reductase